VARGLWLTGVVALFLAAGALAGEREARVDDAARALASAEYAEADRLTAELLTADPGAAVALARAWLDQAAAEMALGNDERSVGLYARAVEFDPALAPEAGRALLERAARLDSEKARLRLTPRALIWAGADAVLQNSLQWFTARWGPPREVALELPGWTELGRLAPGDEVRFLSLHPFRERDVGAVRIFPASADRPVRYRFTPDDTGGAERARVELSRHDLPVRVYLWIFPDT